VRGPPTRSCSHDRSPPVDRRTIGIGRSRRAPSDRVPLSSKAVAIGCSQMKPTGSASTRGCRTNPPARPTLRSGFIGLDAGRGKAAYVRSLPRGLDGTRVVVPSNPGRRILSGHAAKLSDAGQRGSRAAYAAAAGDFDAPAVNGETMRFLEHRPRFLGVRWQPEVGPPKPPTRPLRLSGSPAEEVEPPLRVGLQHRTLAEAATAKTRTVGQLHNAWSRLPRHRLMVSGPASQTAKVALADHGAAEVQEGFV
jgi:hypothetical protein